MSSNITHAAPGAHGVDPNHPARGRTHIIDREQAIIEETAPDGSARTKVAICGFAASSRMLAPFDDPSWSIWSLNQLYRHIPRADRQFDIHANFDKDNVEGTDHPGWLAQCGIPVYMTKTHPEIPTSVAFPLDRVIARVTSIDYFTSTVAFMVALAVCEADEHVDAAIEALVHEAEDARDRNDAGEAIRVIEDPRKFLAWRADRYAEYWISLYGIDLVVGTEYDWQKSCVEFMLGLAQARNITIRLPAECALLKQRWRYGYEAEPTGQLVKLSELERRMAAHNADRQKLLQQLVAIDGAIAEASYWGQVADLRSKGGTVVLNESSG